ncbi:MAG: hypothetical protein JWO88_1717 [Frankiales bacterium]|nr:hypothetical protein [Frankiales bacterium]
MAAEPRDHARRLAPLVAAAAVVAIVAGVGALVAQLRTDDHVVPAGESQVVPWADLPAVQEAPPSPLPGPSPDASIPACRASELSARYGAIEGATGSTLQWIVLTDVGAGPCRLGGHLERLTALQGSVRREISLAQLPELGGLVPAVLDPHGLAGELMFTWYGRCDEQGMPRQTPYSDLVLTLLGGDVPIGTDMAGSGIPAGLDLGCLPTGSPISVSPLGSAPPEPRYAHDPRTDLTVTIESPASIAAGSVLHYSVRLTNSTSTPIPLDPCPSFLQTLGSAKTSNQLNCPAAHAVPARGDETFAMELPVPTSAKPGAAQFTWIFGYPSHAQAGHGTVTISNPDYVAPSPPPECTPDSVEVPCAKGMENGVAYPYTALAHCGFTSLVADGRRWSPNGGPLGDGNAPPGWGNPFDVGTVQLKTADVLVYRSSSGQSVGLHPDDAVPPICS